jgi:hypothetical protein
MAFQPSAYDLSEKPRLRSRLWQRLPMSLRSYIAYLGMVVSAAGSRIWIGLKDYRADAALLTVAGVVALASGRASVKSGVIWGFVALGVLMLLVILWNLALAPWRLHSEQSRVLNRTSESLAKEHKRFEEQDKEWRDDFERTRKEREHLRGLLGTAESRVRELEAAQVEEDLLTLATVFGTELRDIRHRIEMIRAMNPPAYDRGFRFPDEMWKQSREALSTKPELYAAVERAYTAARHVGQSLEVRETRSLTAWTFGVIPDDGLDEAYEAAGEALDALGQPRGEPWQSVDQKAGGQIIEDIRNESEPE